jgi:hypothetical protein
MVNECIRLTPAQQGTFRKLGGGEWLRQILDPKEEPKAQEPQAQQIKPDQN